MLAVEVHRVGRGGRRDDRPEVVADCVERAVAPTQQVEVHSGFFSWFGGNAFGLTLVPLLIGIGFLFFDGKSIPGWVLTGLGTVIIVAGIITNLRIYFVPTSLFNTLMMLGLLAAGLGLVARSLRARKGA